MFFSLFLFSFFRLFVSYLDIRPFELNFDAFLTISSSPLEFPDFESDDNDAEIPDSDSSKRKQPKRAVKAGKTSKLSKVGKVTKNQQPTEEGDNTARKVMIYQGNKFYRDKKVNRRLIWKCSTSRFTNCSAQLTTTLNGKQVILKGSHDHANNTE